MPPGILVDGHPCWDTLDVWTQSKLIAYDQTREYDSNPPPKKTSKAKR